MAAFAPPQIEIFQENITPILNFDIQSYGSFQGSNQTVWNLPVFESNNLFVKIINKFKTDLLLMQSELNIVDEQDLMNKISRNLSTFLELNPTSIKVEISYENSFIFTLKKGDLTCFIEQYFDHINDTIIANIYKGKEHYEFFDGGFNSFCYFIKQLMASNS